MQFKELKIIEPILKALKVQKYTTPTAIQAQAIPLILDNKDVLGSAQTGTGKTAAFAIPILQHLYLNGETKKTKRKIKALVITPTRELAIQIDESFSTYGKFTALKSTVVFGGVAQGNQTSALRKGVDILVATPGRLLDLMNQGFISLADVEYFVLDEADRMLDMGFIQDIRKIIAKLPTERQSLFFSATMPDSIVKLSKDIVSNPVKVDVSPISSTAETLHQYIFYTNKSTKKDLLLYILQDKEIEQVLLFARTKHGADDIVRYLSNNSIRSAAIHGDKAQTKRQQALQDFKDGKIRVLVATDIAARGIDINKLRYVINYQIPNIAETYVHRIGRAGRAGDEGVAISICEPEELAWVKDIESLINQKIEIVSDNPFPQTDRPMTRFERQASDREKLKRRQDYFATKKQRNSSPKATKYKRQKS